ncbi:hypothetical protein NKH47_22680 [Mesorhizobium sp. M1060]|uniref:hypothetical protein n=1 Tax=unclassified Mesorhizobium TaxID=325217 RepID=UPI001FDAB359|nr:MULTISPECIES: hypothetical protein [unclassified Mesorhizobium]WJI50584.1 hypothetical protein NLY44_29515 [Mesorhizobium sp. C089B]WJI67627.1 hypothetical protein NLY36_22825 [Mesorhizobium sp. C399B]
MLGENPQAARARYRQAIKRAESLGFVYRPLAEILVAEPLDTILQSREHDRSTRHITIGGRSRRHRCPS